MSSNEYGLNKVLIAIGNERRQSGYGGNATAELERRGLVMVDPEWSGCITLTEAGWEQHRTLTETRAEREHPEWFEPDDAACGQADETPEVCEACGGKVRFGRCRDCGWQPD